MPKTYIVGYDTSAGADRAVEFAVAQAKGTGAAIKIVHVLEWSAYSFLTPQELEERHQRRTEELDRAAAQVNPVVERVRAQDVECESVIKYGHVADIICDIAEETGAAQIFVGRTGHSALSSRVFGSVQLSLVQASPVAVTVVP
ncbi:universal stress protein [Aestuariispira insulae]|uniref:Nucleotide-binding universal stress UspA family protein n=1 Tax=Aestuariispira insulae TaxID=1461337 RepID=A0A3D9HMN3_9PROT|nr:universal stress protein [Aestuariispira insulae]RED50767.1 nucleotide-binding universal stress UspA family protein [Aestuariispira insulae]